MATLIIETDDGTRVKVVRLAKRTEYLVRERFIRRAVYAALDYDEMVKRVPPR